jgi:RNA recognition motif-containing protein
MRIYVGNLSYNVTEAQLTAEFGIYGNVESTTIPSDRMSGRPKGFAFVEMPSRTEAEAAIAGLNGKMLNERTMTVNEARPRDDNRSRGHYGSNSGGNYGRGGYGGGGSSRSGGDKKRRY